MRSAEGLANEVLDLGRGDEQQFVTGFQGLVDLRLPRDAALVTILRGGRVIVPQADEPLEAGDELLFVASPEVEDLIREALS